MESLETRLEKLGQTMGGSLDDPSVDERIIAEARLRFFSSARQRGFSATRGRRRRFAPVLSLAAVALAGAALVLGSLLRPAAPISFLVEAPNSAEVGDWLETRDETLQLRFSEGTRVSLFPETRLQVRQTSAQGAEVMLARGRTHARIEPHADARWTLFAGPYTVKVTGTEFDLSWHPAARRFELVMHSGTVLVSGPRLGERKVRQGEVLRVETGSPPTQVGSEKAAAAPDEHHGAAHPSGEDAERAPEAMATSSVRVPGADVRAHAGRLTVSVEAPAWRAALEQGDGPRALAALRRHGAAAALQEATPTELRRIADAARLNSQPRLAVDALQALRSRHGVRGETAYLLGKIAADQLGARAEAAKWFDTYLRESNQGALAEQALGRLVELRAGSAAGRAAAQRYLDRYPRGVFAANARRELERP